MPESGPVVLVTSAGTIVGQGIIKCLRIANPGGGERYRIIAADSSPLAPSVYRADVGLLAPPIPSPSYIDFIIRVCKEEKVRAVFPGADEELSLLAGSASRIRSESGAVVLSEPQRVISLGADKWKTFRFLEAKGIPCAKSALPDDRDSIIREFGYPVVVKPREGHGSVHFYVASNPDEVDLAISRISRFGWLPLVQEYLEDEGNEFTVGVTVAATPRIMSSIAMKRTLKAGQTSRAFVDDYEDVRAVAEEVALKARCRGPVNIQARMDGGVPKVFEVNPRFSASCPIRAVAGVNEPDIVFRNQVLGEEVRVAGYHRLVCLRFLQELYLPYADHDSLLMDSAITRNRSFVPDYF